MGEAAYLVRVNLQQLAQNLRWRYAKPFTTSDAADWLTQPGQEYRQNVGAYVGHMAQEHSPFWRTDVPGVFYSLEDPRAYLYDEEILTVKPAKAVALARRPIVTMDLVAA